MKEKSLTLSKSLGIGAFVAVIASAFLVSGVKPADAAKTGLSGFDCVVQPSIVADLGVAVPGIINVLHFDRADYVSAGTVLAELDSDLERASLALAERLSTVSTALELRQLNAAFGSRTLERNQALYQKSSISRQTLDQVKTESRIAALQVQQERENREIARLEAERAKAALKRRQVISPIDGAITERYKSIGEYVSDEPVFQVAQLDPLRIEVVVPLKNLNEIESGMNADVTLLVDGFGDENRIATVRRIDPVADAASGTYGVWLELPNPDLTIPSGVRCQVDFLAN